MNHSVTDEERGLLMSGSGEAWGQAVKLRSKLRKNKGKKRHLFKNVKIVNRPRKFIISTASIYYHLVSVNWLFLCLEIAAVYTILAAIFFGFYVIAEKHGGLSPAPGGLELFFFSFGRLTGLSGSANTTTTISNFLAILQSYLYIVLSALITGVFYARFSKPQGKARFSKFAIISRWNGTRCLMLRAANSRTTRLVQAEAKLFLLRDEQTAEGSFHARMYDLPLHREFSPNFSTYTWTIRHTIDENSALYNKTSDDLLNSESRIVIQLSGVDMMYSDTVHVQHSWLPEEILFDVRFEDMVSVTPEGTQIIDYANFDKICSMDSRSIN